MPEEEKEDANKNIQLGQNQIFSGTIKAANLDKNVEKSPSPRPQ